MLSCIEQTHCKTRHVYVHYLDSLAGTEFCEFIQQIEMYPKFGRLHSQIRQTWRYKVTIARTHTILQMHVFNLGCTNTHDDYGKDVHALEHERSISDSFSEW